MKSLFEEIGGTYTLGTDGMYYPDLALPEEEPHYGKYGRMRLLHLKEHHKVLYNTLCVDVSVPMWRQRYWQGRCMSVFR